MFCRMPKMQVTNDISKHGNSNHKIRPVIIKIDSTKQIHNSKYIDHQVLNENFQIVPTTA